MLTIPSVRTSGLRALIIPPVLFFASIPLTSLLARSNIILNTLDFILSTLILTADPITPARRLSGLSTLYFIATHVFASAGSMAAIASGHQKGRDNKHPRRYVAELTGLPLRTYSAHVHMMEHLSGYALMVALGLGDGGQGTSEVVVRLLGLHVMLKVFV